MFTVDLADIHQTILSLETSMYSALERTGCHLVLRKAQLNTRTDDESGRKRGVKGSKKESARRGMREYQHDASEEGTRGKNFYSLCDLEDETPA